MRIAKLALVLALFLPSLAEAAKVEGFTGCEVKQLATYWGTSPGKAAKRMKKAMATGDKAFWDDVSMAKYKPANCRFAETGLTPYDAEILAAYWGLDVKGAKALVEEKAAYGSLDFAWAALADASYAAKYGDQKYYEGYTENPEQAALDAFWASQYQYCDARMLAEFWGSDDLTVKAAIGYKMMANNPEELAYLQQQVQQGRTAALGAGRGCQFVETNYTYEDASVLAQVWRTSVESAKARIADAVGHGRDAEVRQQMAIARQNGVQ